MNDSTEKDHLLVGKKISELYCFETIVINRALPPQKKMLHLSRWFQKVTFTEESKCISMEERINSIGIKTLSQSNNMMNRKIIKENAKYQG